MVCIPSTGFGQEDVVGRLQIGKDPALGAYFRKLYADGEHDAVLNLDMLGVAAMGIRDYKTAEKAFDQAIVRIEGIMVADPNAEKAKRYFEEERIKDFKGEPYERAMTYYYRGLLYARDGDFQNARAAFLGGGLQAARSTSESFERSFGAMNFLAAWASRCDGDDVRAKDLRVAAEKEDPSLVSAPPVSNVALLFEVGEGPAKEGSGRYKELLTFVDRSPSVGQKSVSVTPANDRDRPVATVALAPIGDLFLQATTRGGRPIQGILDGKAQFKETAGEVSQAGLATAVVASSIAATPNLNSNVAMGAGIAGLIGVAVSLIAAGAEKATKPAADTRFWSTLPRTILYADLSGISASSEMVGLVRDTNGSDRTGTRILVDRPSCTLLWGHQGLAVPDATSLKPDPSKDRGHSDADARFRASLLETFQ